MKPARLQIRPPRHGSLEIKTDANRIGPKGKSDWANGTQVGRRKRQILLAKGARGLKA